MPRAIDFKKLQKFSEKRLRGVGKVMMLTEEISPIGLKEGDMSVWLWGGNVFDRAGRPIDESNIPDWVMEKAGKVSREKLEKAGWLARVEDRKSKNQRMGKS